MRASKDCASARGGSARTGRELRRILTAAIAVLAIGVVMPSVAGAFGSSLQWKGQAFMPVTSSQSATWEGSITVTDHESEYPTAGFDYSVQCSDKLEGSIGVGGTGEITKMTVSSCTGLGACKKETAKMVGGRLPWHTELVKSELGPPIERIVSGGKGAPEFEIQCHGLIEDYCKGNVSLNVTKIEPAAGTFNRNEGLTCFLSNEKPTGSVEGSQTLTGPTSLEEGTPIWGSAKAIEWSKGRLTLIDRPNGPNGAPWGVTCEESGSGTAAAAGAGTITKITLSKCEQSAESECKGTDSLEALHLPWKTQLYFGDEEVFSNAISEGGSGTVAFKIDCTSGGVKEEDTCHASSSSRLATYMTPGVEGGVKAKYYLPSEGIYLECGRGSGLSELIESSHIVMGASISG